MEIYFEEIDSTNNFARREYLSLPKEGISVIRADAQTSGRGQLSKRWISPPKTNLLATFAFRLPNPYPHLHSLALLMARSLAVVLANEGIASELKWPNDLLIKGKKVAGILCETVVEKEFIQAMIGVGLNLNMEEEDLAKIDQPATSLKVETGKSWDIALMCQKLKEQFSADLRESQRALDAPCF